MKEFKGTKKEWKTKGRVNVRVYSQGIILSYPICDMDSFDKSIEENQANAKLIAAAPDLLKALQEVKAILKKAWPKNEWEEFAENETSFNKAINKALD